MLPVAEGIPEPLHDIRPVDTRGRDLNQYFAGPWARHRSRTVRSTSGPPGLAISMAVISSGMAVMAQFSRTRCARQEREFDGISASESSISSAAKPV